MGSVISQRLDQIQERHLCKLPPEHDQCAIARSGEYALVPVSGKALLSGDKTFYVMPGRDYGDVLLFRSEPAAALARDDGSLSQAHCEPSCAPPPPTTTTPPPTHSGSGGPAGGLEGRCIVQREPPALKKRPNESLSTHHDHSTAAKPTSSMLPPSTQPDGGLGTPAARETAGGAECSRQLQHAPSLLPGPGQSSRGRRWWEGCGARQDTSPAAEGAAVRWGSQPLALWKKDDRQTSIEQLAQKQIAPRKTAQPFYTDPWQDREMHPSSHVISSLLSGVNFANMKEEELKLTENEAKAVASYNLLVDATNQLKSLIQGSEPGEMAAQDTSADRKPQQSSSSYFPPIHHGNQITSSILTKDFVIKSNPSESMSVGLPHLSNTNKQLNSTGSIKPKSTNIGCVTKNSLWRSTLSDGRSAIGDIELGAGRAAMKLSLSPSFGTQRAAGLAGPSPSTMPSSSSSSLSGTKPPRSPQQRPRAPMLSPTSPGGGGGGGGGTNQPDHPSLQSGSAGLSSSGSSSGSSHSKKSPLRAHPVPLGFDRPSTLRLGAPGRSQPPGPGRGAHSSKQAGLAAFSKVLARDTRADMMFAEVGALRNLLKGQMTPFLQGEDASSRNKGIINFYRASREPDEGAIRPSPVTGGFHGTVYTQEQIEAAILIQTHYRRHLAQKEIKQMMKSASTIQKIFRRWHNKSQAESKTTPAHSSTSANEKPSYGKAPPTAGNHANILEGIPEGGVFPGSNLSGFHTYSKPELGVLHPEQKLDTSNLQFSSVTDRLRHRLTCHESGPSALAGEAELSRKSSVEHAKDQALDNGMQKNKDFFEEYRAEIDRNIKLAGEMAELSLGEDYSPRKVLLISTKVPKCETLAKAALPEVITVIYDHKEATLTSILGEIQERLSAYKKGAKIKSMCISCKGSPGCFYLLAGTPVTPAKLCKMPELAMFWSILGSFMSNIGSLDSQDSQDSRGQTSSLHLMESNCAGNRQGEKLLDLLSEAMRPASVAVHSPLEISKAGHEMVSTYYNPLSYKTWKSSRYTKLKLY